MNRNSSKENRHSVHTVTQVLIASLILLTACSRAISGEGIQTGQKLAFMGDSITQNGWESPGGYVKLVIDGLKQAGISVTPIPAGISGHKSNDMLARLDRDVVDARHFRYFAGDGAEVRRLVG